MCHNEVHTEMLLRLLAHRNGFVSRFLGTMIVTAVESSLITSARWKGGSTLEVLSSIYNLGARYDLPFENSILADNNQAVPLEEEDVPFDDDPFDPPPLS